MSISNLTSSQLRHAASILEQIEELRAELNQLGGGQAAAPSKPVETESAEAEPVRKRKKISAAGIARIRAAQKLRWAKVHAAKRK